MQIWAYIYVYIIYFSFFFFPTTCTQFGSYRVNCLCNLLFTCRILLFVNINSILGICKLKFKHNFIMDATFVLKALTLPLLMHLYSIKSFLLTIVPKKSNVCICIKLPDNRVIANLRGFNGFYITYWISIWNLCILKTNLFVLL